MKQAEFKAHRITREYRQTIEASAETVFPLLCPVREAQWLDGWRYSMKRRIPCCRLILLFILALLMIFVTPRDVISGECVDDTELQRMIEEMKMRGATQETIDAMIRQVKSLCESSQEVPENEAADLDHALRSIWKEMRVSLA